MNITIKFAALVVGWGGILSGFGVSAKALDIATGVEFQGRVVEQNVGGGFSYLPDGDVLGFSSDFLNGPTLFRFDGNGDGVPAAGPKVLAQFDFNTFPAFVQVAPSGAFALVGVSGGASKVFRVDLLSDSVEEYFDAPGNYDLTFMTNELAYLSTNPGGFDPSAPNQLSLVQLTEPPVVTVVAEFNDTPSGPVAVNVSADLYYIKGTFAFPPPMGSSRLFKFSAKALAQAAATGVVLNEAASLIDVPLNGGYDLVYQNGGVGKEALFVSTIGNQVLRLPEATLVPEVFLTLTDSVFPLSNPAITTLSFTKTFGVFDATATSPTKLGMAVATEFFSKFSLVELRSTTFDGDGDGAADGIDECPLDSTKATRGVCGCAVPEIDANADGVVDCGSPRVFSQELVPVLNGASVIDRRVFVQLEALSDPNLRYELEIWGPMPKARKKSVTSTAPAALSQKLKAGQYLVRYRISQKVGRRRLRSAWSEVVLVDVL